MASRSDLLSPRYVFYALGAGCLGLAGVHLAVAGTDVGTVLEAAMIGGLSTTVLHTASRLPDRGISRAGQRRAAVLALGVAGSFALLALAVWLTWGLKGQQTGLSFLLAFATALGASMGTWGALYTVQTEEQITRARELAKLLTINQRVLRHNLRNELTVALGHLDNLEATDDPQVEEHSIRVIREHLHALNETSDRARRIVSIWETDDTREFDLVDVVESEVASFRERHPEITITDTLPERCRVVAHPEFPTALREALHNVVEHNPPDVSVAVRVRCEGGDATVEVVDTGTGIPKADRTAIGLPGETELTHGQGMGLWLIYWVVRTSGGKLDLEPNEPSGTVVRMTLPRSRSGSFRN